jgi:hypothetical protein
LKRIAPAVHFGKKISYVPDHGGCKDNLISILVLDSNMHRLVIYFIGTALRTYASKSYVHQGVLLPSDLIFGRKKISAS